MRKHLTFWLCYWIQANVTVHWMFAAALIFWWYLLILVSITKSSDSLFSDFFLGCKAFRCAMNIQYTTFMLPCRNLCIVWWLWYRKDVHSTSILEMFSFAIFKFILQWLFITILSISHCFEKEMTRNFVCVCVCVCCYAATHMLPSHPMYFTPSLAHHVVIPWSHTHLF